jgi:VWFA-related protein
LTPATLVTNEEPLNRRLFVLVIDTLHIRPADMPRARQLLTGLLEGLSPDDSMALVTTGPSEASVDLTSDPVLQARAVVQLGQKAGTPYGFAARPGYEINFAILENVTEALARSRHVRRVVVYVSPAVPFELTWLDHLGTLRMLREGFSRSVEAARRANVAVYAINPLGLDGFDVESGSVGDVHDSFARQAGGRGFGRWSDYRAVARQILADNGTFYVLRYYRDPVTAPDRTPSIDVKATKPNLEVRARTGYVAEPATQTTPATLAEPLALDACGCARRSPPAKPLATVSQPI